MKARKRIVRIKSYRIQVQRNYRKLELLKSRDDAKAFYALFLNSIPEMGSYINAQLNEMEHSGTLPSNFYKEDDFIDDLFIATYNAFDEIKTDDEFYIFLFKELNLLLEKVKEKELSIHESLENIDDYARAERDRMREKMATQLDGDIILEEELDDISYATHKEEFKTIFEVESEQKMEEYLDKTSTQTWTSQHANKVINSLPASYRNIASLYIHFHLSIPEITEVTRQSSQQVHQAINAIKESFKAYLFNN
jgi:DNA-directed RNA polymerase specialized sigma24 family protein